MEVRSIFLIILFTSGSIYLIYDNIRLYTKVKKSSHPALLKERMRSNYFLLVILIAAICDKF